MCRVKDPRMNRQDFSKIFLLIMLFCISALFLTMIWSFLITVILAAIFAALSRPLHRRLQRALGGRSRLAAGATLAVIFVAVFLPLGAFLGALTAEAIAVSQSVTPWVQEQISEPGAFAETLKEFPFYDRIIPYKSAILQRGGELAGKVTGFLANSVSSLTVFTAQYVLLMFILFYSMYFFLVDGDRIMKRLLFYLPLQPVDRDRMLERFTSVTRATLKSFLIIGALQGGLTGVALAMAGVPELLAVGRDRCRCVSCAGRRNRFGLAARGRHPGDERSLGQGHRVDRLLRGGGRQRRFLPSTAVGRKRHAPARTDGPARNTRGAGGLRPGRVHHWPDRSSPDGHHMGDVRCGF